MNRTIWLAVCTLAINAYGLCAEPEPQAPPKQVLRVDTKGVTASILYEAVIAGGHIPEVRSKFKLRITEIVVAPGGYVGEHNHMGPGIRQMTEGEMEYIMPDKTMVYRPGDYFFEAGDVSHRVLNKTQQPCKHLLFEILPADVAGPSLIPSRDRGTQ